MTLWDLLGEVPDRRQSQGRRCPLQALLGIALAAAEGPATGESMAYRMLAFDYDGTLAEDGALDPAALAALEEAKRAGFLLGLVTGRPHEELVGICPEIGLFDLVVDENGSVLYFPGTGKVEDLGPSPPVRFAAELVRRGIRHSLGRVVVRTWRPHLQEALAVIRDLGLLLDVIPNKFAVMIVPRGIDKGTGLEAGLERLGVAASETVAAGDDENDRAVFRVAAVRVAVANAVEALKAEADVVLARPNGAGVAEFIRERLLKGWAGEKSLGDSLRSSRGVDRR